MPSAYPNSPVYMAGFRNVGLQIFIMRRAADASPAIGLGVKNRIIEIM